MPCQRTCTATNWQGAKPINVDLNAIVVAVHDILKKDDRTKALAWILARRGIDAAQRREHGVGAVFLGPGRLGGASIPSGAATIFDVVVLLRYWAWGQVGEAGIANAEEARDDGLNAVLSVLWDNRNLGLPRVMFHTSAWGLTSNVETSPAYAEATISVSVVART